MGKSTDFPLCDLCNTNHPRGGRHSWDKSDEPQTRQVEKPARRLQDVQAVEGERRANGKPSGGEVQRPQTPYERIAEGLTEAIAVAKGDAEPHRLHKRGRPSTGFDKKAHDRHKAAERRAKRKTSNADDPAPR